MRKQIEKFSGELTLADLAAINELDIDDGYDIKDRPLRDLMGLEYMINLESFRISSGYYNIIDLPDIRNLKKLQRFEVYEQTGIHDISVLAHLPELTEVWLTGTLVTDITPLFGLKKLENVWLPKHVCQSYVRQLNQVIAQTDSVWAEQLEVENYTDYGCP